MVLSILFSFSLSTKISDIKFSDDLTSQVVGESGADVQAFNSFKEVFFKDGSEFVLLLHDSKNTNSKLTKRWLDDIALLTEQIEYLQGVHRVRSLSNIPFIHSYSDEISISNVSDEMDGELYELTKFIENDPTIYHIFVSKEYNTAAFFLAKDVSTKEGDKELYLSLTNIVEQFVENNQNYDYGILGKPVLEVTSRSMLRADLQYVAPLILMFLVAAIYIIFKEVFPVVMTMMVLISTMVSLLGVISILKIELNNLNIVAPLVTVVLCVLDAIHFISSYKSNLGVYENRREVLSRTLKSIRSPIIFTSVTTAFSFLALNVSQSPAIASLGNIAAIGSMLALVNTFLILPAMSITIRTGVSREHDKINALLARINGFSNRRAKEIVLLFIFLSMFSIYFASKIKFDDEISKYFDEDVPFTQSIKLSNQHWWGSRYYIVYDYQNEETISSHQFQAEVDKLQSEIRDLDGVVSVYSYVDISKKIHMILNNGETEYMSVSEDRQLLAQIKLLFEMSLPDPSYAEELYNQANSKMVTTIATKSFSRQGSIGLIKEVETLANKRNLNAEIYFTGHRYVWDKLIVTLMSEMLVGFGVILLIATACMVLSLKSFKYGLISIVPNVIPALFVFGFCGLIGKDLAFTSLLLLTVSLGMVIDDTIHMLHHYLKSYRADDDHYQASNNMFEVSGRAVLMTTSIFAIGVFPLLFSSYVPTQELIKLAVPISIVAVICDFTLLPALMKLLNASSGQVKSTRQ